MRDREIRVANQFCMSATNSAKANVDLEKRLSDEIAFKCIQLDLNVNTKVENRESILKEIERKKQILKDLEDVKYD